jgi:hypothetical protein
LQATSGARRGARRGPAMTRPGAARAPADARAPRRRPTLRVTAGRGSRSERVIVGRGTRRNGGRGDPPNARVHCGPRARDGPRGDGRSRPRCPAPHARQVLRDVRRRVGAGRVDRRRREPGGRSTLLTRVADPSGGTPCPRQETDPVDRCARFTDDHRHGPHSTTELCARHCVCRPTGYESLARHDAGGGPVRRRRAPDVGPGQAARPAPRAASGRRTAERPHASRGGVPTCRPTARFTPSTIDRVARRRRPASAAGVEPGYRPPPVAARARCASATSTSSGSGPA